MPLPTAPDRAPPLARRTWHDALALAAALAALLAWDALGLDLPLVTWYGSAQGFAWNHHWFTAGVLHEGGRAVAAAVLVGLVVIQFKPFGAARPLPAAARRWWLAVTVLCLLLIPLLKRASLTSCPSELLQFGGAAQYISHWAWGVRDGGPGHCFPSGHASSAFAFIGGYFVLRDRSARAARVWLALVLLLGAAYGWGQMMRGSHYVSHTLWTAWICTAVSMAAAWLGTARGWLPPAGDSDQWGAGSMR